MSPWTVWLAGERTTITKKLLAVADFYEVKKEVVDYWITESYGSIH